jgi:hypothetical protein
MAMAAGIWSFRNSRLGLYALPVIAFAGCAIWLLLPGPSDAQNPDNSTPPVQQSAASLNAAVTPAATSPGVTGQPVAPALAAAPTETPQITETPQVATSPLDGLKISSQSWRRGGLGSKALVTFTLRNANEYAVKDIEIACSFTRRDGRHLTDRKRLIPDTVEMKSRKTFAKMHVGFVNVNADKAKCSLVTANRAQG